MHTDVYTCGAIQYIVIKSKNVSTLYSISRNYPFVDTTRFMRLLINVAHYATTLQQGTSYVCCDGLKNIRTSKNNEYVGFVARFGGIIISLSVSVNPIRLNISMR